MRIRIGITTSGRAEEGCKNTFYSEFYHVPALYVDAVRRAGGLPMLLPPGYQLEDIAALLMPLDAIIVTGGADIAPAHYGGNAQHPQLGTHDAQRDESELALTRHIIRHSTLPALFVCRGMQMLNVALGGTLHEHLDSALHRAPEIGWVQHDIQATQGSILEEAMGTLRATTFSGHHQAVKDIAPELESIATAEDGIVEALAHRHRERVLAVQWHPEKSAAQDASQQRIFNWLVTTARTAALAHQASAASSTSS